MFKLCLMAILAYSVNAGVIPSEIGLGLGDVGHVAVAAPVAQLTHIATPVAHVAAPVAVASHGAVSWQNSNSISLNPTAVVAKVAAPIAVAAPVVTRIATPVITKVTSLGNVGFGGIGLGNGVGWNKNSIGWNGNGVGWNGNGVGWNGVGWNGNGIGWNGNGVGWNGNGLDWNRNGNGWNGNVAGWGK